MAGAAVQPQLDRAILSKRVDQFSPDTQIKEGRIQYVIEDDEDEDELFVFSVALYFCM